MNQFRHSRTKADWPKGGPLVGPPAAGCEPAPDSKNALESAELLLDGHKIVRCSAAAARLFAYPQDEMLGLPVTQLLPILASFDLPRSDAIDPTLAFLCRSGITFTAIGGDGTTFRCHLTLAHRGDSGPGAFSLFVAPVDGDTRSGN